jgi:predicted pyridoxine 5'-phosphate oxidase superfamily flavin-nucleotide-binding protein
MPPRGTQGLVPCQPVVVCGMHDLRMSIRHLDSLFEPASVAVIGASDRAGSVGATVWRNLRQGATAAR